MFERFTERARQVVVLAQEEARALWHNYIGTEHILLGLLREEKGLGAQVLVSQGVLYKRARRQAVQIVGWGEEVTSGQIPFTPRAKKVLELALREALSLGHNYVGTEHLLLGLVREGRGVGARILHDEFNLTDEDVRNGVIRALSPPSAAALGLMKAQANAALLIAQAQATLDAVTKQTNAEVAQQQAIVDRTSSMTQTQYAGSGLTVSIEGINPTDAANIAKEVGWRLCEEIGHRVDTRTLEKHGGATVWDLTGQCARCGFEVIAYRETSDGGAR